ncbi:transposase [Petrimonas sp.]|uniref:transposase n=1 Tax=Petrimonas sp. TaxID=2023866 RepID=UPI003F514FB5
MAQSLSQLFVHIIFHVKTTSVVIREQEADELYAYIGSIIKDRQSIPISINGVGDHIHILCILSKNVALADFLEDVKKYSSRWIKTKDNYYKTFAWQGGYGGFSVSPSLCDKTKQYIQKQKEHHKKMTFQEEYLLFLKEYGIEYDEKYLWRD